MLVGLLLVSPTSMNATLAHKVSAAAHEALPHANPLSLAQMNKLATLALERHPRTAVEVGCGPGTFSIGLVKRSDIRVTAFEINPYFVIRARQSVAREQLVGEVAFLQEDAKTYAGEKVDLMICIGSSEAFGTPRQAISHATNLLQTNGTLVFGDLVWLSPPPQQFLDFLGAPEELYWSAECSSQVFATEDLVLHAELRASVESWEEYEGAILTGRLALANTLSVDEGHALRERAHGWFHEYKARGQHCLGFAAYVATRRGG